MIKFVSENFKPGHNLTANEIHQLATYNSEVSRGLLHRSDWMRTMFELQQRFDMPDDMPEAQGSAIRDEQPDTAELFKKGSL